MKILVCGGREFSDQEVINYVLGQYDISLIIQGGSTGADFLAKKYATENQIQYEEYPADWDHHGHMAGPIRNQQMIERRPDLVIAFPGGKGTKDMIKRSLKYNIDVIEIYEFEGEYKSIIHEAKRN